MWATQTLTCRLASLFHRRARQRGESDYVTNGVNMLDAV